MQRCRPGTILDLARHVDQGEHLVQIGQALLDLAIQHAQKVQRNVQLDHEGVDHHQVTDRQPPLGHPLRRPPQHGHQRNRNDQLLPAVEQAQRALTLDRRLAVLLQAHVITRCLILLIVEVLDGLVVEQGIHRPTVRHRIQPVHFTPQFGTPLRHAHGEEDIQHQRHAGNQGKSGIELHRQDAKHQTHFDQRRQDAVQGE